MKQYLLATTAILLAATSAYGHGDQVSAEAAHANGEHVSTAQQSTKDLQPKVELSGQASFEYYFFENKNVKEYRDTFNLTESNLVGKGQGMLAAVNDSKFNVTASAATDAGLKYGVTFIFTGDRSRSQSVKESFVFLNNSWGSAFLGDRAGVEDKMAFGGFSVAGELDGNWTRVLAQTTGSYNTIDLIGDTAESTKITLQTPRFKGFQFGVSFTPKSTHVGEENLNTLTGKDGSGNNRPFNRNSVALGLNYENKFTNGVSLALSATGIFARNVAAIRGESFTAVPGEAVREDIRSYALGGVIGYQDWAFGAEWIDNGKSNQFKRLGGKAPKAYDFGLSYNFGSIKLALGYFHSDRDMSYGTNANAQGIVVDGPDGNPVAGINGKAKTDVYTIRADKQLAPGLAIYAAYDHIKQTNPNATYEASLNGAIDRTYGNPIRDNKADIFIVGTQVKF